MTSPDSHLHVPILMAAFEAEVDNSVLKIEGPIGVTFPPRLPFELSQLVAVVIENTEPQTSTTKVRIALAGPDGAILPDSVRDHTVRWTPNFAPGGPQFNNIIDTVSATVSAQGAYSVHVFIGDDPNPRAVTSFGLFLQ
jgi:hypothetical protein